jgi:4'-phosphopantetheinyl transferase
MHVMAMDNRAHPVQRQLTLREVHLWLTFTSGVSESLAETFRHSLLSEDERQREGKFFFAADRHRFVVTRALLRTSLSRYAAVSPAAWRFEVDEYGRPHATQSRLVFNISHTSGLVAIAITREAAVGVDVENVDRAADILGIARQNFAPAEYRELLTTPQDARAERFFHYWTLKEAYCKAEGRGLSLLDRVRFDLSDDDQAIRHDGADLDWHFSLLKLSREHVAAICCRIAEPELTITRAVPLRCDEPFHCTPLRTSCSLRTTRSPAQVAL